MSLAVIAVCVEAYQVGAHTHCLSGRTLPQSHRNTLGFGAAILGDLLSYLLSCYCLYAVGAGWALLLLPVVAHVAYWTMLVFVRPLYLRMHDYRLGNIYADGSLCRSKRIAAALDTGMHLLAAVLIARTLSAPELLVAATVGAAGYLFVFHPRAVEGLVGRLRSAAVTRNQQV